jgi:hypothetical protein
MSGEPSTDLQKPSAGYSPALPDPQLRLSEFQAVASFLKQFDSPVIRWSIYAAGAAGACDVLHWIVVVFKAR